MASVQVRHSRSCPANPGGQEALEASIARSCGCAWSASIVTRHAEGGREPIPRAGRNVEKYLEIIGKRMQAIEVHVDEGSYEAPVHVRFSTFADEWLESLRRRSTTHATYAVTLGCAKR